MAASRNHLHKPENNRSLRCVSAFSTPSAPRDGCLPLIPGKCGSTGCLRATPAICAQRRLSARNTAGHKKRLKTLENTLRRLAPVAWPAALLRERPTPFSKESSSACRNAATF